MLTQLTQPKTSSSVIARSPRRSNLSVGSILLTQPTIANKQPTTRRGEGIILSYFQLKFYNLQLIFKGSTPPKGGTGPEGGRDLFAIDITTNTCYYPNSDDELVFRCEKPIRYIKILLRKEKKVTTKERFIQEAESLGYKNNGDIEYIWLVHPKTSVTVSEERDVIKEDVDAIAVRINYAYPYTDLELGFAVLHKEDVRDWLSNVLDISRQKKTKVLV